MSKLLSITGDVSHPLQLASEACLTQVKCSTEWASSTVTTCACFTQQICYLSMFNSILPVELNCLSNATVATAVTITPMMTINKNSYYYF